MLIVALWWGRLHNVMSIPNGPLYHLTLRACNVVPKDLEDHSGVFGFLVDIPAATVATTTATMDMGVRIVVRVVPMEMGISLVSLMMRFPGRDSSKGGRNRIVTCYKIIERFHRLGWAVEESKT